MVPGQVGWVFEEIMYFSFRSTDALSFRTRLM